MNEIKAVIFDLDGTLIDTLSYWKAKNKEWLEKAIKREISDEEAEKTCGPGFKDVLLSFGVPDDRANDIVKQRDEEYLRNLDKIKLFPQVIFALEDLEFNGYKLGILTNNRKPIIEKVLDHFQIRDKFSSIIGDEFGSKPNPKGLLKVVEELNVDKKKALYVGDTEIDRQTAEAAGIKPVIIGKDIKGIEDITAFINWYKYQYRYF